MAFGTVLGSYPAPGNASSIRGIAWDGAHLWINDHKNTAMLVCDPRSLTQVGSFRTTAAVVRQWAGTKLILGDNSILSTWQAGQGSVSTLIVSGVTGAVLAGVLVGASLLTVNSAGALVTYATIPGQLSVAVSSTRPTAFNPDPVLATDGVFLYTSTPGASLLNKHSLPSFSIVATASKPAADQTDGLHWGGNVLWVSIGGSTDRIYKVAAY